MTLNDCFHHFLEVVIVNSQHNHFSLLIIKINNLRKKMKTSFLGACDGNVFFCFFFCKFNALMIWSLQISTAKKGKKITLKLNILPKLKVLIVKS